MNKFEQEKQAFEQLKPELLKTHQGEYVVIRDGKAVLFGLNKTELARQAYQQFGYGPLYIGLVQEGDEVVYLPNYPSAIGNKIFIQLDPAN